MTDKSGIPIFEETMKKFDNLGFLRDESKSYKLSTRRDGNGRWVEVEFDHVEVPEAGWYQDKAGKLYNYDGVIWDEVPEMKLADLEYLG